MARGCVFAKGEILSVLNILEREYQKTAKLPSLTNNRLLKSYSKMAVIAAGGWVEDGIKSLMQISIERLNDLNGQTRLTNEADNIWGFGYKRHLSKGMMLAFGAHGLEFVERVVGSTNIAILSSSLGNLKAWRDDAAHSYVLTIKCNPAMVIKEIEKIFPILKHIEKCAREYRKLHY